MGKLTDEEVMDHTFGTRLNLFWRNPVVVIMGVLFLEIK